MQPKADRDELVALNLILADNTRLATSPTLTTAPNAPTALEILRSDGAVERQVRKLRDALQRDSSDINALIDYIAYLSIFLELQLPDKLDLFMEPLHFLASVLEQVRKGSSPAVLSRKVHSRPMDSLLKQLFKIGCVVAGDLHLEADKQAGLERRYLKRSEADAIICRRSKVQKAAKRFGLSPTPTTIKGWRREIREAHENSDLKFVEEELRAGAKKILEMYGLQEAIKFLLDAFADERFIV